MREEFDAVRASLENKDARLPTTQIVALLDSMTGADAERAHGLADSLLLHAVPIEVKEAYERLVDRADFWATA